MRYISNNALAAIIIVLTVIITSLNLFMLHNLSPSSVGYAAAVGQTSVCLNREPAPVFSQCGNAISYLPYDCFVNTTDYKESQSRTFSDNTSLFDINNQTGEVSFTPSQTDAGWHSILITVNDHSGCNTSVSSGVWNLYINASTGQQKMKLWSDTDNMTKYKYDPITFYTNLTDNITNITIAGANCSIAFNTSGTFSSYKGMVYNSTSKIYQYTAGSGFLQGNHTFRVLCDARNASYGISQKDNTFYVTNRPPYLYAAFPNITMNQGSAVSGYNLNDYFKDPDLDILTFTSSNPANIQISFTSQGVITIQPDSYFYGSKIAYIYASDGFDQAISNPINITVIQTVSQPQQQPPPSGGGGGGYSVPPQCAENWNCSDWGVCQATGIQTRNCVDENDCGTINTRPDLSQNCTYVGTCQDKIKNCHTGACETGVDCGGPCDACATCHDGIKNQGETGVDCGGPCGTCQTNSSKPPQTENPSVVPPKVKKAGISLLLGIILAAILTAIVSMIMHQNVMEKVRKYAGHYLHAPLLRSSDEALYLLASELVLAEYEKGRIAYAEALSKISGYTRSLLMKYFIVGHEPTFDEIRKVSAEKADKKIDAMIQAHTSLLERAEYSGKPSDYPLVKIVDKGVMLSRDLMLTNRYHKQLSSIISHPAGEKKRLLNETLNSVQTLIDRNRILSASTLMHEVVYYYKALGVKGSYKNKIMGLTKVLEEKAAELRNSG